MGTKHTVQAQAQETQANAESRVSAAQETALAPAGKETSVNYYPAQGPQPGLCGENVGESAQESATLALLATLRPLSANAEMAETVGAALWEMALAQEKAEMESAAQALAEKRLAALGAALGINPAVGNGAALLAKFAEKQPTRAAAILQAAGLGESAAGRGRRAKPAPVVPSESLAQYTPESWARACLAAGKNAWGLERGTLRHHYCLLVAQHTPAGGLKIATIQAKVGAVRPQNNLTREMANAAPATAYLPARPAFVARVNGKVVATSAGLAAWQAYLALTGQA